MVEISSSFERPTNSFTFMTYSIHPVVLFRLLRFCTVKLKKLSEKNMIFSDYDFL